MKSLIIIYLLWLIHGTEIARQHQFALGIIYAAFLVSAIINLIIFLIEKEVL